MDVFNRIMQKTFNSSVSKKTGRPIRSTGNSEERGRNCRSDQAGIRKQVELNFVPLS
jgi:hypothetical protein